MRHNYEGITPFKPEPFWRLVARWTEAIKVAHDVRVCIVEGVPKDHWEKYTFDFYEGMRMMAIVEKHPDKHARLHVCCLPMADTQLMDAMAKGTVTVERLTEIAEYRARRMSQVQVEKSFLDTNLGAVHLFFPALPGEVRDVMYSGHLDLC
jgi:hypothetical protein